MTTRELARSEWTSFFNSFSRIHRGELVTVDVAGGEIGERPRLLARRSPLIGITVETEYEADGDDDIKAVEIALATAADGHLIHIINEPRAVKVGQVSDGQDDLLVIESLRDPTVRVWFGPATDVETGAAAVGAGAIDHAVEPFS